MFTNFSLEQHFPFQSRFATVAGHRMHYIDEGTGPVVLLLHGNPTWCFFYRHLVKDLRENFRVIALDYLGCGLSDRPAQKRYRATDRIQQVQSLINQLGINEFSLVMHDWGGPIGTGVAVRNLDKVRKLAYLNTTLTETESLPLMIKTAASPLLGKFMTQTTMRFLKLMTSFGVCHTLSPEVCQGYYYPYRSAERRAAIWDFVADIPFDNGHPSYAEMLDIASKLPLLSNLPVQIIWGLKDPCFHREMLSHVAKHFPQARVLEIPDASHLVLEDAPQIANSAIRKFLLGNEPIVHEEEKNPALVTDSQTNTSVLVRALTTIVQRSPHSDAVIMPSFLGRSVRYSHINFKELYLLINKYQRGLAELGLEQGDRVLMFVPAGVEFLALSYAVMARGAIPVFIDPGMKRAQLVRCIEDADPQVLIGVPRAQLLRLIAPKLFKNLKFKIVASDWISTGGKNLDFLKKFASNPLPLAPSSGTALIAFTSGATGTPKGVIFTERMIEAQLKIFKEELGLQAGGKDLPLLPIFSLFQIALGICSVFPPMDPKHPLALEPDKIIKIINDLAVTSSFGSPTLWNKISEYCVRTGETLSSVQKILMAGAPVSVATLSLVQSIINDGQVVAPYGSTEALPVTLLRASDLHERKVMPAKSGEQGTLVGRAVSGVAYRIIKLSSEPIEEIGQAELLSPYEIGEIIVQGENISPAYLHRPDANRGSKISDGATFWHRMGDVGYVDEHGNLYFCGRKAHIVTVQGKSFYSIPCEMIFNQHHKVRRSALVSLGEQAGPAIVIEPFPQFWPEVEENKEAFSHELVTLAKSSLITSAIERIYFHRSFPVDIRHNAKIFRDQLGEWARAQG